MSAVKRLRSLPRLYRCGIHADGWYCRDCRRSFWHNGKGARRAFVALAAHCIRRHRRLPSGGTGALTSLLIRCEATR